MESAKNPSKPMYFDDELPYELMTDQFFTGRVLSMNRPHASNALNATMARKVTRAVAGMNKGEVTSFFVLRGSGVDDLSERVVVTERDKFFCTGIDLMDLKKAHERGDRAHIQDYFLAENELINTLVNCTKPWAAGMDGSTFGAGTGLAMHALFRFAAPTTTWAIPEAAYGDVPGYGSSFQLPNLAGYLGTYLALTGRRLVGHDLLWAGLASNVVDPAIYGDICLALTHQSSWEMRFVAPVVTSFDSQQGKDKMPFVLEPHLETIERVFRSDSLEKIYEKLEAEDSVFARQTLRTLKQKSPASLKLTLRLLREGQARDDLLDSLSMEFALRTRLWNDSKSDLHAGLKQVVFGKSSNVHWPVNPTDEYVESMFAPLKEPLLSLIELQPLAPRPPLEAPQLTQHLLDAYSIETGPELDMAYETFEGMTYPDEETRHQDESREITKILEDNEHKLLVPSTYWYVSEPLVVPHGMDEAQAMENIIAAGRVDGQDLPLPLIKSESEKEIYGRDSRTGEVFLLPDLVRIELLRDHPNLRSLNVFKMDSYIPHPMIDNMDEEEMAEVHSALRLESGMDPMDGMFPDDKTVSSESMQEVMATRFHDFDEEMETYLRIAGYVPKKVKSESEDYFDWEEDYVPDERPLTAREKTL